MGFGLVGHRKFLRRFWVCGGGGVGEGGRSVWIRLNLLCVDTLGVITAGNYLLLGLAPGDDEDYFSRGPLFGTSPLLLGAAAPSPTLWTS